MRLWIVARTWLMALLTTQETEIERDLRAIFDKLSSEVPVAGSEEQAIPLANSPDPSGRASTS